MRVRIPDRLRRIVVGLGGVAMASGLGLAADFVGGDQFGLPGSGLVGGDTLASQAAEPSRPGTTLREVVGGRAPRIGAARTAGKGRPREASRVTAGAQPSVTVAPAGSDGAAQIASAKPAEDETAPEQTEDPAGTAPGEPAAEAGEGPGGVEEHSSASVSETSPAEEGAGWEPEQLLSAPQGDGYVGGVEEGEAEGRPDGEHGSEQDAGERSEERPAVPSGEPAAES
jgi:hypothetical protein